MVGNTPTLWPVLPFAYVPKDTCLAFALLQGNEGTRVERDPVFHFHSALTASISALVGFAWSRKSMSRISRRAARLVTEEHVTNFSAGHVSSW